MALRDELLTAILTIARRGNVARNQLFAKGMRPTWINRVELEQRKNYSEGYLERGKRSRG